MKKLLCLLFALCGLTAVKAQLIRPEVQLGYGKWTAPVNGKELKDKINSWIPGSSSSLASIHSSGAYQGGIYLKIAKISIGAVGSYEHINAAYNSKGETYTAASNYWTLMGRVKWNYFGAFNIHLYGGLAGGVADIVTTVSGSAQHDGRSRSSKVAYQVTPLGISIGKKFGVFAEAGYGYLGILNGGIKISF